MGVSENSVPLNPMVNDHYPYEMAIIGNIPYFQTNPCGCETYFIIFSLKKETWMKQKINVEMGP